MGIDEVQSLPVHRQRWRAGDRFRTARFLLEAASKDRVLVEEHLPGGVLQGGEIIHPLSGQLPQGRGLPTPQQRQQDPLRHGPGAVHGLGRRGQG